MSGGVAYVWDPNGTFERGLNDNHGLVVLEKVTEARDVETLKTLIENHQRLTRSDRAATILQCWEETLPQFVKVVTHWSIDARKLAQEAEADRASSEPTFRLISSLESEWLRGWHRGIKGLAPLATRLRQGRKPLRGTPNPSLPRKGFRPSDRSI